MAWRSRARQESTPPGVVSVISTPARFASQPSQEGICGRWVFDAIPRRILSGYGPMVQRLYFPVLTASYWSGRIHQYLEFVAKLSVHKFRTRLTEHLEVAGLLRVSLLQKTTERKGKKDVKKKEAHLSASTPTAIWKWQSRQGLSRGEREAR